MAGKLKSKVWDWKIWFRPSITFNEWMNTDWWHFDVCFQNATETKDLKCFYGHSNSPWLRLGPIKIEVQNKEPYLAVLRELLYPHECDNITQFLGPMLGTPPGRMKGGVGKNDWTMKK